MKKVLVLGGGLVGSVVARDLATGGEFDITVADVHPGTSLQALASDQDHITIVEADCSSPERIQDLASGRDLVVGALPGRFGYQALRAVIESGCGYCDISFMPEDAWELDDLAKERGVTCVVDMGVAPGMSNLLAGTAAHRLDPCRAIDIYVGGIPAAPLEPFKYKAAFSPADVIEEYTRPTRLVEDGKIVTRPALSEPELIGFPGVGTLEAFNTDGLRSLVERLDVPFMREKTMRYPGHRDMMLQMREAGFFDEEPIEVNGVEIRPRDLAASLLFPHWTYEEGEADLTVMRVTGTGMLEGKPTRLTWDLHDRADPVSGCSSMSRTTAFPCTIMARMIIEGAVDEPGVHVPEDFASREDVLDSLLRGLEERGITYTERVEAVGPSE
ncbi:MAG: saccharopine dehydrogenase [Phycisphaerae bacterium]|nr:saccharopine dehydrogenase [Phycisphaerae bacterium]